jgi:Histone methylation protein DOT1
VLPSAPVDPALRKSAVEAHTELVAGTLRGSVFTKRLRTVPKEDRDEWIDEVLALDPIPPDDGLPRGAVPYLPCGVAEIMAMIQEVQLRADDTFVDVGSGLGRVSILAHLFSGARAHGIEIQKHLAYRSMETARDLKLDAVTFEHGNAAETMPEATVYFFYSPCNGEMLQRVMERMHAVALKHPIRICTVDLRLPDVAWLVEKETPFSALYCYSSQ